MSDDFDVRNKILYKYNGDEQHVILPDGIIEIGMGSFRDCSNLASIVIHEGVKLIGIRAFQNCIALTAFHIPRSVIMICENAFTGCTNLQSVVLPEGLTSIAENVFSGCSTLSSVQIPNSVTEIRYGAFMNCNRLASIMILKTIKEVNEGAFLGCYQLEISVYYHHQPNIISTVPGFRKKSLRLLDEENHTIGKLFVLDKKTSSPGNEFASRLMSGQVNHLSEYDELFLSSDEIVIRKARAAICRLEYPLELLEEYKKGYITYLKKHASLLVPYLIKTGDITSISIFAKVEAIPQENLQDYIDTANILSNTELLAILLDYQDKTKLRGAALSLDLETKKPLSNWVTYENEDGTLTITKYIGNDQDVTIPATINGKKVKSIEGNIGSLKISVLYPHKTLVQSVIIEEGIEEIGEHAFLECRNLKSIAIPSSVTEIGKESFGWCNNLISVVIPESVKSIGERAFENCFSLSSLHIPASVEKIGKNAFTSIGNSDEVLPYLVIHSPKGSYAIKYAKENGIKYAET